mmetsp:Transcript_99528/g.257369  ORF Transcript_99528/g.257369 Transcript_99528/m.257369 type:complete len:274 (+) Transcript_99528:2470-3291(+)
MHRRALEAEMQQHAYTTLRYELRAEVGAQWIQSALLIFIMNLGARPVHKSCVHRNLIHDRPPSELHKPSNCGNNNNAKDNVEDAPGPPGSRQAPTIIKIVTNLALDALVGIQRALLTTRHLTKSTDATLRVGNAWGHAWSVHALICRDTTVKANPSKIVLHERALARAHPGSFLWCSEGFKACRFFATEFLVPFFGCVSCSEQSPFQLWPPTSRHMAAFHDDTTGMRYEDELEEQPQQQPLEAPHPSSYPARSTACKAGIAYFIGSNEGNTGA